MIIGREYFMNLTNNTFENNSAYFGGGAIYFNNKLPDVSPDQNNIFNGNKAYFANDFYTFPMRLRFKDNMEFDSLINTSTYSFIVVSGITKINLYFQVLDFYNQTIKSLNGRFYF